MNSLRKMLSEKLVECKKQEGLTYKQINEKSGCSISTIRYALNGGDGVSMENFEKLFKSVGVSLLSIEVEFDEDWDV